MEDLREFWNSKMEEQCVKPQNQDQSKRVRTGKVFSLSKDLLTVNILKCAALLLLPHNPHQTCWHQVPCTRVMFPEPISPSKE